MFSLKQSVGKTAVNAAVDVIKAQLLLNNNNLYTGLKAPLAITGTSDGVFTGAVEAFQATHPLLKMKQPDGRVDPGGQTLLRLNEYNNREQMCINWLPVGFSNNYFVRFNITSFLDLYGLQYRPALGAAGRQGLESLVNRLTDDAAVIDIRWAAYMLATVKHECADTWQPIEEYGKGADKAYGKAIKVPDPADPQEKKFLLNAYYGRGYVQLTWETNYEKMDRALSLIGDASLHLYPSRALDPGTAYAIMSYGMRNGSFTGKKLSDYISGGNADYQNARRIINGIDRASLIRGYAEEIEFLLRFCNGVQ